jgi:1-acyl-sn-glycerol-3-phosphate acyltransferase
LLDLIRGILTLASYICFTFVIFVLFMVITLFKLLVPHPLARALAVRMMDILSSRCWVFCANLTHRIFGNIEWVVTGETDFKTDKWSVILSNHQTWVDILVLIKVFYRKIPPYKFFIKKQLLWMPLMGPCFWALDYPIMRRYSKEFLAKNPHLKGKDREATRAACQKYRYLPVTLISFPEGTRFRAEKHHRQNSPYRNLLIPRAGGASMAFYAMGDLLEHIVDVTIVYPDGAPGLWTFFRGRSRRIRVDIRVMDMDARLAGNYDRDPTYRQAFQEWLNQLWVEKDERICQMKAAALPEGPAK